MDLKHNKSGLRNISPITQDTERNKKHEERAEERGEQRKKEQGIEEL
jgi:hypothetical protein